MKKFLIHEAELRVQRSRIKLEQSVLHYLYISFETTFIQQEALSFANIFRNIILNDGQEQVDRLDAIRQTRCLIHKISVCKSMSDKLVALALKPVPDKLDDQLTSNLQQKINDRNISKLCQFLK